MRRSPSLCILLALALLLPAAVQGATTVTLEQERVRLWIPAVGQRENGTLFGIASDLEVVMQRPGSGRVFVSTQPLTQVDMQGSARLAVDAASSVTGINADAVDFFFSVRTPAVTIGGPSAGGAMAVAVAALLQGWPVREDVVMTGMINPDGSIGPIGGVLQKLEAADSVGATVFLVPLGQARVLDAQNHVVDVVEYGRERFGIQVLEVADLYEAVGPFTGNRLVRPTATTDPLQDAAYADITNRLSQNLTERAQSRQADLQARYGRLQIRAQNDRELVEQQLRSGDQLLEAALGSRTAAKHYLAASQAFQSLVAYGYAEALLAYFEGGAEDVERYASDYLETTEAFLATIERETKVTYPIEAAQLDSVGAAEDRFMEAQALQAQAQQAHAQRNRGETLRLSSFARERAESARWWTEIGREVAATSDAPQVTEATLRALLDKYFDAATLELEYAALIAGNQPNFQNARQAILAAEQAREQGRLAASLNNLVEAFARTSTALVELAGPEQVRQRLPNLADAAAYEIEAARSQDIPPIFAVSVLELGQSQIDSDPVSAYASMLQARISARTSLQIAKLPAPAPGVEPYRGPGGLRNAAPAWIALGIVLAVIATLVVLVTLNAEARRARPTGSPPFPVADTPPEPPPTSGGFILVDEAPPPPPPAPVEPGSAPNAQEHFAPPTAPAASGAKPRRARTTADRPPARRRSPGAARKPRRRPADDER